MEEQYIIGLDIGTTSCKSMVVSRQGTPVGNETAYYPILSPHPSWAEQDPEAIFTAVLEAVNGSIASSEIEPDQVVGIGLSAAMHSVLAVDAQGNPLTRAMIWADTRSAASSAQLRAKYDSRRMYARTGCPVHPMYPLSKIDWLRSNLPEVYQEAHKFISIKEYVIHRLLGRYVVDRSVASATGLFDIQKLDWDEEALEMVGIDPDRLSRHVSTTTVLDGIGSSYAEAMGVRPDCLLIVGAGDGLLSNVGAGSVGPGQVTCMIGSSGAVRVTSEQPVVDDNERTWCYLLTDEVWVVGAAINNAGLVYQWFRERFHPGEEGTYAALDEEAAEGGVGAEGLIFLPYLTGERSPNWNPNARGVLFGLSLRHDRRHFVRAIMEGVAYRMYSVLLALEEVTGEVRELRGSGGFLRSPLWIQIMADVCGRELVVPQVIETTSLGAAFLAMYALGQITDLKDVRRYVPVEARYSPSMENHELYLRLFDVYQEVYQGVAAQFPRICEIQAASIQPSGEPH
jgi:gluconokinase